MNDPNIPEALQSLKLDTRGVELLYPQAAASPKRDRAGERAWRTGSPQWFPYLRRWWRRHFRR